MSTINDLKPWQQIVAWTFMIIVTIGMFLLLVFASAKYGLMIWETYKQIGWFGIIFFILGTIGMGFLWVTVNFTMAVIRRIMKWKWLQIPME